MTGEQAVWTVTQLTQAIKQQLENSFRFISIQGEVSNFKCQSSGHLYFSLKDDDSQIAAVMFRSHAQHLTRLPKDGDKVYVKGEISVYPPRGNYQILIYEMQHAGVGELLLKLEELKHKLHQLGWFDPKHKKPLPKLPRSIGVVTSPTGAAIQDILNVLNRRFTGFHLILNPVRVQGNEAPLEIAEAIRQFNEHKLVDVIIVGRGGGSIEDLWAFNEEIVAKAIFESTIPIIAAVGHETDHSIADYIADVRAPTPSAAAQIVIAEKAHQEQVILQYRQRLYQIMTHLITSYRHRLNGIMRQPWYTAPYTIIGPYCQRLDDLRSQIDDSMGRLLSNQKLKLNSIKQTLDTLCPTNQIFYFRKKLLEYDQRLTDAWTLMQRYRKDKLDREDLYKKINDLWYNNLHKKKDSLKQVAKMLEALNPKHLLTKGYSIVFAEKDNSIIKDVHSLKSEDKINVLLSNGQIKAKVEEICPK